MKKIGMILGFLFVTTMVFAQADLITKVAVVDIQTVYRGISQSDPGVKRLEEMRTTHNNEVRKREEIIAALQEQRNEAVMNDSSDSVLRDLDRRINQRENELRSFRASSEQRIATAGRELQPDPELTRRILAAIEAVANQRGYALVFAAANSGLAYWSNKVDITREVTAYLLARQPS
jgi:Skp family chaperone for outer membrane proteins